MKPLLIIGSGLAGYTVAREFRKLNASRAIVLVTRDNGDFYSKPALSNALAQGKTATQLVNATASAMASQLALTLVSGASVTRIDTTRCEVETSQGRFEYGDLVLALGASPLQLPVAGNAAEQLLSVNNLPDYVAFRNKLKGKRRVLVVGAGLIGCEFANDLALGGYEPVVVSPSRSALPSLLPQNAGTRLVESLGRAGVAWKFGSTLSALDADNEALAATLSFGEVLSVDAAVSAVGLSPNISLAALAGLRVDRGVCVDAYGRTSLSNVFAVGDCAQYEQGVLPFVMPLMAAARAIASTLAGAESIIDFGPLPVSVKTTSHPVAVYLRDGQRGLESGNWEEESTLEGMQLLQRDGAGNLSGFVVTGSFASRRSSLVKQLL